MSDSSWVDDTAPRRIGSARGRLLRVSGTVIHARLPLAAIGDLCIIRGDTPRRAAVIGFDGDLVSLAPLDDTTGLVVGASIDSTGHPLRLPSGCTQPGSIVDAVGASLEAAPPHRGFSPPQFEIPIFSPPPKARTRPIIAAQLTTGIRVIDALYPLGYGQRIGLFAPPGLGKSSLLGMLVRRADFDLAVVGLVGERGREVNEFIDETLSAAGRERAVVVVSTSDESPLRRTLAAHTATTIADYHRSLGKRVLLVIDSLTRTARALREIGLSAGELPVRQGFTPSVYTELPRLLERSGTAPNGSVTAIYTILTPGAGESDPLGEEVKGLLDGHLVLSAEALTQGRRPAIDLTQSISRLAARLLDAESRSAAETVLQAAYRLVRDRDLVAFGGIPGPELAAALRCEQRLLDFLRQEGSDFTPLQETKKRLHELAELLRASREELAPDSAQHQPAEKRNNLPRQHSDAISASRRSYRG